MYRLDLAPLDIPPHLLMPPFIILVTGWRDWPKNRREWVAARLWDIQDNLMPPGHNHIIVRHGMCPYGGVDEYADDWAFEEGKRQAKLGVRIVPERVPADWRQFGRGAGMMRNADMVKRGANICLAFPGPGTKRMTNPPPGGPTTGSSGTVDCGNKAISAGIETFWLPWHEMSPSCG